jgi:hypothetical protein
MAAWDMFVWTCKFLKDLLEMEQGCNTIENRVFAMVIPPEMFPSYKEVFISCGWKDVHYMIWHKTGHNTTGVNCYIYACEMILVAYKRTKAKCNWFFASNPNPTLRHNFIEMPAVTDKAKYADGTLVNIHEKPPELCQFFCNNHCKPGDNVLVLGAGSGADIIGALRADCNVVAIEQDPKQHSYFSLRLAEEKAKRATEANEGLESDQELDEPKSPKLDVEPHSGKNLPRKGDGKKEDENGKDSASENKTITPAQPKNPEGDADQSKKNKNPDDAKEEKKGSNKRQKTGENKEVNSGAQPGKEPPKKTPKETPPKEIPSETRPKTPEIEVTCAVCKKACDNTFECSCGKHAGRCCLVEDVHPADPKNILIGCSKKCLKAMVARASKELKKTKSTKK